MNTARLKEDSEYLLMSMVNMPSTFSNLDGFHRLGNESKPKQGVYVASIPSNDFDGGPLHNFVL
jgi:hypothetical protein